MNFLKETEGCENYISPRWINSSGIAEYNRCPRSYFFNQGLGLELDIEKGPGGPLEFGGAMHRGLPHALDGNLPLAWEMFDREWDDDMMNDGKKHQQCHAHAILADYMGQRANGRGVFSVVPEDEVAAWAVPQPDLTYFNSSSAPVAKYELGFSVDIGIDVPLVGKIDAPVRMNHDQSLWVMDFKTTSGMQSMENCFSLYTPTFVYMIGLSEIQPEPVQGVIFDMILKAIKKRDCASEVVPVEPWMLENAKDYIRDTWASIRTSEITGHWPQNFSGCAAYSSWGVAFGTCKYQMLCKSSDWATMAGMFKESSFHETVRLTLKGKEIENGSD